MKMRTILSIAVFLVCAVALAAGPASTKFGAGVTDDKLMPVAELMSSPESYVDKEVQVEGVIQDVCTRMGCWIEIASEDGKQSIRLKVEDGDIIFPKEVKGKWAEARGTLRKMELSEERAIAREEHFAEEQGKEFDADSIQGPQTIYQLDGIGALVYDSKKPRKS